MDVVSIQPTESLRLSLYAIDVSNCFLLTESFITTLCNHGDHPSLDLSLLRMKSLFFLRDESVIRLAKNCPLLSMIDLCGCVNITNSSILVVAQLCVNLVHLDLCNGVSIDDSADALMSNKTIKLFSLHDRSGVTDTSIIPLVKACGKLERLSLNYSSVTDMALEAIARCATNLQWLSIRYCRNVSTSGIRNLLSESSAAPLRVLYMSKLHKTEDVLQWAASRKVSVHFATNPCSRAK